MDPRSRAGCPTRRTLSFQRARRSARLSTATLEGAQHSTWGAGCRLGFGGTTFVYVVQTEASQVTRGRSVHNW